MKRLNVSMIVTGFPTPDNPSHGVFNERAAKLLSDYVDLTVLQLRVWKPGRKFVVLISDKPYKHYSVSAPHLPFGNNNILCTLLRLYKRILRRNLKEPLNETDVFHSVGASFSGALGADLALRLDKAHVMQLIGTDINSELPNLINKSCFKVLKEKTDGVGCNSLELKHKYEKLFGETKNIDVIYRGIDTQKFGYSFNEDDPVRFLFLGGIPFYKHIESGRNLKGGLDLMKAWELKESEFSEKNCKLIFAGPDADSEFAKKWRDTLKYPNNVVLRGVLSPEEVAGEYKNCHVVLIPSLEEGMPNVALEAGSSGKCLIASKIGGLPELIDNGNTGLLIAPGNPNELAEAMEEVALNKNMMKEMGLKLRENIVKNFDSKAFPKKYFDLYKRAMGQN